MYTIQFPRLDYSRFIHRYVVHEEKVIHLQICLYHGRPLVLASQGCMYDIITSHPDIYFVPDLSDLSFEFEDLPGQRYDVDLSNAAWKARVLYF
jgi:hypothetical protein